MIAVPTQHLHFIDKPSLLSRLQSASEGSRELDVYIWAEFNGRNVRTNDNNLVLAKNRQAPHDECLLGYIDPGEHSRNFRIAGHKPGILHYTTSLDAALSLVPEGMCWSIEERKTDHFVMAAVHEDQNSIQRNHSVAGKRGKARTGMCKLHRSYETTPALALCVAIINARQVEQKGFA